MATRLKDKVGKKTAIAGALAATALTAAAALRNEKTRQKLKALRGLAGARQANTDVINDISDVITEIFKVRESLSKMLPQERYRTDAKKRKTRAALLQRFNDVANQLMKMKDHLYQIQAEDDVNVADIVTNPTTSEDEGEGTMSEYEGEKKEEQLGEIKAPAGGGFSFHVSSGSDGGGAATADLPEVAAPSSIPPAAGGVSTADLPEVAAATSIPPAAGGGGGDESTGVPSSPKKSRSRSRSPHPPSPPARLSPHHTLRSGKEYDDSGADIPVRRRRRPSSIDREMQRTHQLFETPADSDDESDDDSAEE
jgi:hypothetical protein